jgi:maltose alpha-D-glucosyltransferase/alpha-amylase
MIDGKADWYKDAVIYEVRVRSFYDSNVFSDAGSEHALAFVREHGDDRVLCAFNLSRFTRPLAIELSRWKGFTPVELFGGLRFPAIGAEPWNLSLGPRGFCWFNLEKAT